MVIVNDSQGDEPLSPSDERIIDMLNTIKEANANGTIASPTLPQPRTPRPSTLLPKSLCCEFTVTPGGSPPSDGCYETQSEDHGGYYTDGSATNSPPASALQAAPNMPAFAELGTISPAPSSHLLKQEICRLFPLAVSYLRAKDEGHGTLWLDHHEPEAATELDK